MSKRCHADIKTFVQSVFFIYILCVILRKEFVRDGVPVVIMAGANIAAILVIVDHGLTACLLYCVDWSTVYKV